MSKQTDAIKIKQDRGQIMVSLDLFYPDPVMLKTLYRTLCNDLYDRSKFQRDITLLTQKGYLQMTRNKLDDSGDWWTQMCLLTASGKQIAEGTKTDEALEI